jgi:hypothetical protein
MLRKKGHELSSDSYIWMWSTEDVIRPQRSSTFTDLLVILQELGAWPPGADAQRDAKLRWEKMKELVHYHHLAGVKIRKALLDRLRELIVEGVSIPDSRELSLPRGSGGQLSVFRVLAVDREAVELAYQDVGVLRTL